MSTPNAPVKTPLGQQELRQRTQRLGQRHRTVLLLVDGRRPLAEVLSMARQAGAEVSHFEELVQLGMIELPAPEPVALPADEPADATAAAAPDGADGAVGPDAGAVAGAVAGAEPEADSLPGARGAEVQASPAPPAAAPIPQAPQPAPDAALPAPPVAPDAPPALPVAATPEPPPPSDASRKLDEVRRLLTDTLRRDTLLLRVFAPARVRAAQTQEELIGLVWEIERQRAHARRKRGQLLNLQRARELLGMGNTVVAEDSLPWTPPEA